MIIYTLGYIKNLFLSDVSLDVRCECGKDKYPNQVRLFKCMGLD